MPLSLSGCANRPELYDICHCLVGIHLDFFFRESRRVRHFSARNPRVESVHTPAGRCGVVAPMAVHDVLGSAELSQIAEDCGFVRLIDSREVPSGSAIAPITCWRQPRGSSFSRSTRSRARVRSNARSTS